jgi:hypothetical protein
MPVFLFRAGGFKTKTERQAIACGGFLTRKMAAYGQKDKRFRFFKQALPIYWNIVMFTMAFSKGACEIRGRGRKNFSSQQACNCCVTGLLARKAY